jgi:ABC-type dipeptide/oligopeptide/nickel transport system permease component
MRSAADEFAGRFAPGGRAPASPKPEDDFLSLAITTISLLGLASERESDTDVGRGGIAVTYWRYVRGRIIQGIVTIFLLTLIAHASISVLPGDPVRALFGFRPPPPDVYQEIVRRFHLDQPYWRQYLYYLNDLIHGDLGLSLAGDPRGITRSARVGDILSSAWPVTAILVGLSLALQLVIGLGGGVLAALKREGYLSRAVVGLAVFLAGVPVLLSAWVLRMYLGPLPTGLNWFPGFGLYGGWRSYVLPVTAVSASTLGSVILLFRSELRASLHSSFARFATAAGISRRRVVGVHAGKASLAPVLSYLSANLGIIVTSLLIVEGIYALPGIGYVIFQAVRARDRSLVIGTTLVVAVAVVIANLFMDLLAAAVDPRLRVGEVP